jgi:hypothetical protein
MMGCVGKQRGDKLLLCWMVTWCRSWVAFRPIGFGSSCNGERVHHEISQDIFLKKDIPGYLFEKRYPEISLDVFSAKKTFQDRWLVV